MNMLREFFKYFISVMMGKRDSLTAFLEPLTMGERYLRWGVETRDIRDFRAAMDYMHLCHDRDAPMASLLIRKYACIGDITSAAIETLLMKHQRVVEDSVKTENSFREELDTAVRKIGEGREYMRRLQDEGSLIKAKNEESRIAELEENARRLREMLETGESRTSVYESYDEITADGQRFFRELDHASSMVMASAMLGTDAAETLAAQLRSKLETLRDRVERANPVRADGAGRAANPGEAALAAGGVPGRPAQTGQAAQAARPGRRSAAEAAG